MLGMDDRLLLWSGSLPRIIQLGMGVLSSDPWQKIRETAANEFLRKKS